MSAIINVRAQFALWYGLEMLLLAAIALIAVIRLDRSNDQIKNLVSYKFQQTILAIEISDNINTAALSLPAALLTDNMDSIVQEITRIRDVHKIIQADLDKLEPLINSEQGKVIFKSVIETRANYLRGQERILGLLSDGKRKEAATYFNEIRTIQQAYVDAVGALAKFSGELMQITGKEAIEKYNSTNTLLLILFGSALVLAGISAYRITRNMPRPAGRAFDRIWGIGIFGNGETALILEGLSPMQRVGSQEKQQASREQAIKPVSVRKKSYQMFY